ncbi:DUF3617 domain-containing protein [Sphingomonas sp. SRS2]|uniref:DUF3617 domain-containing protein n=1 Tax=Sphingomonas sp. SRS2 TaxID=133190 RepID=UPI000618420B|nr:DUF3617 domain-containing protein [Sphingomonas sp. SRS2]KKC23781.1 hypothetical protein WP12_22940 [Sphingomonas sp. SRS2]
MNKWTVLLLAGLAAPVAAEGFAPGKWQHETKTISAEVPGVPQWVVKMFAGNSSRKSCLTAQQAVSRPEALLTQDDAAVCTKRKFSLAGGKIIYDTFCTNKRFPEGLLVASKGNYTADSYEISTLTTGTKEGEPVRIVTTGAGRRTGATCK